MNRFVVFLLLLSLPLKGCTSCGNSLTTRAADRRIAQALPSTSTPVSQSSTALEIPAHNKDAFIIYYTGYTVCYDEANRIPLWVAYELTAEEANGTVGRSGKNFRPDERLNAVQADNFDYRGSGWSRGHMAPAGDFKWDEQAMWDTFYYTNCCPQDEKLNNGSWNVLENKVRAWARQFGSVFVVTGPIIGKNANGKIGPHQITVPDAFFKAILVCIEGEYHGIAFTMNNNSTTQRLSDCCLSINELEKNSGIDFFPTLDDDVEEIIEDTVEPSYWIR